MLLKKSLTYQKGLTLVELLIAITLLGLIAATGIVIDFTSRMALIRGKKRVEVRGKASFAMEHMVRHIRFANKVSGGGINITIRSDYNLQTGAALKTPSNFTDDYEANYEREVASNKLRYRYRSGSGGWGNWEDIATDVTSCSFTIISSDPPGVEKVKISMTVISGAEIVSLETTVSLWCRGNKTIP